MTFLFRWAHIFLLATPLLAAEPEVRPEELPRTPPTAADQALSTITVRAGFHAELMAAAFLMDIATYHLGPVKQVYSDPATMFDMFPFDGRGGRIAAKLIAFYNRRLTVLARKRIAAGVYGKRNAGWRLLIPGFTPDPKVSGRLLFSGIARWLKMELGALWLPGA